MLSDEEQYHKQLAEMALFEAQYRQLMKQHQPSPPEPVLKLTTPLVGWRGWRLLPDRHLGSAIQMGVKWPWRKPLQVDDPNWHMDPGTNGIHAYKFRKQVLPTCEYSTDVVGEVWLWGRVIEHTEGYRAEFAYPKKLYVPDSTDPLVVMELEDGYGVGVEMLKEMVKAQSQLTTTLTVPSGVSSFFHNGIQYAYMNTAPTTATFTLPTNAQAQASQAQLQQLQQLQQLGWISAKTEMGTKTP
jgi:hypothetical protein